MCGVCRCYVVWHSQTLTLNRRGTTVNGMLQSHNIRIFTTKIITNLFPYALDNTAIHINNRYLSCDESLRRSMLKEVTVDYPNGLMNLRPDGLDVRRP